MLKPQPAPQGMNVNIESCEDIVCPECESKYWIQASTLKMLPQLLSPTGKNELINAQTFVCRNCGYDVRHVLETK